MATLSEQSEDKSLESGEPDVEKLLEEAEENLVQDDSIQVNKYNEETTSRLYGVINIEHSDRGAEVSEYGTFRVEQDPCTGEIIETEYHESDLDAKRQAGWSTKYLDTFPEK